MPIRIENSTKCHNKQQWPVWKLRHTFMGLGWSLLCATVFNAPGIRLVRTTCGNASFSKHVLELYPKSIWYTQLVYYLTTQTLLLNWNQHLALWKFVGLNLTIWFFVSFIELMSKPKEGSSKGRALELCKLYIHGWSIP